MGSFLVFYLISTLHVFAARHVSPDLILTYSDAGRTFMIYILQPRKLDDLLKIGNSQSQALTPGLSVMLDSLSLSVHASFPANSSLYLKTQT